MKTRRFTVREEANALILGALRNGYLEDLHAAPMSRITDKEMKKLMIETTAMLEWLLELKEKDPEEYWQRIEQLHEQCTHWDTEWKFVPKSFEERLERESQQRREGTAESSDEPEKAGSTLEPDPRSFRKVSKKE
jgi:hypothetical protein